MSIKSFFQKIVNDAIKQPAKTSSNEKGKHKNSKLAWGGSAKHKDPFFQPIDLLTDRADGIYPYRLLVVSAKTNKAISRGRGKGSRPQVVKYMSDTGGVSYKYGGAVKIWEFVLPITPQQLSITDHYAINTTATMRGIVEEHNGVKFKTISASGTTGIWPKRNNIEDPVPTIPVLGGLLSGLSETFETAKKDFKKLITGSNPKPTKLDFDKDNGGRNTGYFQSLLLQQFLEQYAMHKKDPNKKHWRLVFDCPKTNESFVVTPVSYTASKSHRSPGEALYNIQLKAWKRIQLDQGKIKKRRGVIEPLDTTFLQKLANTADNGRSFMASSTNVVKSVRADFRRPFDIMRKFTLLIKDIAGLALKVSDLPNAIARDITAATKKITKDLAQSQELFDAAFSTDKGASRSSQKGIKNTVSSIKASDDKNEGFSDTDIENGLLGVEARDAQRVSPINKIFDNPEENFDFFNGINIDDLELTPEQTNAIEDEIELNSLISIEEIRGFIIEIQDLILDLSNNFGTGDVFFSEVYGRPVPKERATPITLEEFELITALEEVVLQMNILVATRELDDSRTQSSLEYIGGLANDSEIDFNSTTTAKILAPVPFGLTIQQISARYLDDIDRYNEIITINNLRSPYIDEDGFFYSFLSNGDGRQFNIETKENLYVGQKIQISSNTVALFTRKISEIEKITDTNYLVTVDGISDLDLLTTTDAAKMRAFLPGTTNSQNQIYIPSDEPLSPEPRTFDIPHLDGDTLTGLSKIDWLLQDNGDVVLNSFGEVNLANGLTNLIQALKMKILTEKGRLISDNEYGLGISPGVNVTEVTIETVLIDLTNMILEDSRFEGVDEIELNILPPDISITIKAVLADGRGVFPINFTV